MQTLVLAERANADSNLLLTNNGRDSANNLEREASALLNRSTVVVGSVVGDSLEESVQKRA